MGYADQVFDLSGKVVVVTGGSRGLGKEIASAVARCGADVVIASRKLANCEEVAKQIAAETGRETYPYGVHIGRWDFKGPFRLAALIGERMVAAGGGSIINVSSAGSIRPVGQIVPYAGAKRQVRSSGSMGGHSKWHGISPQIPSSRSFLTGPTASSPTRCTRSTPSGHTTATSRPPA
jgi:short-subunit dehydrogenase